MSSETKSMLKDMSENLAYNPKTGEITYKNSRNGTKNPGEKAGNLDHQGYLRVCYKDKWFMVHRVAWALFYGNWPVFNIDHINRDRADNRILNLRDVPHWMNTMNKGGYTNKTGFRGVANKGGLWQARISFRGKTKSMGYFRCPTSAALAYDKAAVETFGDFATLNFPRGV